MNSHDFISRISKLSDPASTEHDKSIFSAESRSIIEFGRLDDILRLDEVESLPNILFIDNLLPDYLKDDPEEAP